MKTIVVPVDYSTHAEHAARYAVHLGKAMKSKLHLCYAFQVPADAVGAAHVTWPVYDYVALAEANEKEIAHLAARLAERDCSTANPDSFHPPISGAAVPGEATDVIQELADEKKAGMIVMGMSGASTLARTLLGSVVRRTLDKITYPVLLVPADYQFQDIRKIAFASDFNPSDIHVIQSLVPLAKCFDADLVITHVTEEPEDNPGYRKESSEFLNTVTNEINYDKIYFRNICNAGVDQGLDWLTDHVKIDMLVMVHRQQGLIARIFNDSHTKKMVAGIKLPLLVFPSGKHFTF